jgi:hypothetical protein
MLLNFLFSIVSWFLSVLDFLLPDFETAPFPDGYVDFFGDLFSYMHALVQLPILRVFYQVVTDTLIPLLLAFFVLYVVLRILNFVRGSGSL